MSNRYPHDPGAKGPDGTSLDAAEAIKPFASHLRRIAMRSLHHLGEATVLEAVAVAEVILWASALTGWHPLAGIRLSRLTFPPIRTVADAVGASAALLEALAAGDVTPG